MRKSVLVVRSLMGRSQLLSNSWLYSVCCINCSVPNAYQLTNTCLSGLEPLILCDGVAARGWPVNDWQWHDWWKYSYALYVSVCVCTARQFCWLQCFFSNGMNVNASLLPALKPPDPAQGRSTMRFAHLLVSEVMFYLKLKHGVGKLPYYFLFSLKW